MNYEELRSKHRKLIEPPNMEDGLNKMRHAMPQIGNNQDMISDLKDNGHSSKDEKADPMTLVPTQKHFNDDKVRSLMAQPSTKPIIVSNDNHILDGHHRWLAAANNKTKLNVHRVSLGINDLLDFVKDKPYTSSKKLAEDSSPVVSIGGGAMTQDPVVRRNPSIIRRKKIEDPLEGEEDDSIIPITRA